MAAEWAAEQVATVGMAAEVSSRRAALVAAAGVGMREEAVAGSVGAMVAVGREAEAMERGWGHTQTR